MQKDDILHQPEEVTNNCSLREQQENFSVAFLLQIINGTEDPILVKDRQHRWVLINDAFCNFLRRSREELIGKLDYDLLPKAEADVMWEQDELVLMTGIANENEESFTNNQGQTRFISTKKCLFEDDAGNKFVIASIRDVTQYKQVEADLRQSKQLLQLVIDNIPQGIFWKDRNSVYLGCNQNFLRDTSIDSVETLLGLNDYDLPWQKGEADWYRKCDRQVMASGTAELHIIEPLQKPDGKQHWIDTNKIPLRDVQGNVVGILGTYEDITERQQTEKALRQSETKFQKLSANVPGMLYQFMLHPDGSFSFPYVNSGSYEIYELTPEEIQADASLIIAIVHADEREEFVNSIAVSGQTLQPWQWQGRIVLPDGKFKWIQGVSRPELQADGSIIWDGLVIDITPRKQIEEALQQAYAELEKRVEERTKQLAQSNEVLQTEIKERQQAEAQLLEKEQFLRSVYDGSEHCIFVVDILEDGDVCYTGWNPSTERATKLSNINVIGKKPEDVHGAVEGAAVRQRFIKCLTAGTPITQESCLTFEGQKTWWLTTINPLKDSEGKIYRLVGTTLNITERIRAETQIKQQAEDLETALQELQRTQLQLVQSEKMSGLGQLVAGIAHEINNPVSFIYGNLAHANDYIQDLVRLLQLYQQHYPQPLTEIQELAAEIEVEFLIEDLLKLFNSMKVGAKRIQEIVLSLRNFSRMDEAEMKEVNIYEGIDSALMILEHRIRATSDRPAIQVIKEYNELPLVECYAGQLNQVFMNILTNAIDALEESTVQNPRLLVKPQIHICTQLLKPNQVVIRIADNGAGILEEVKQRLFDPFFSTKPIGKGTGMGLSISYQIISQKHGGTLECVSQPGNGAEFVITIPLRQG
ncbi:PAS domain-containing protein [Nostoc sp. UHCC 0302]|uniref:PAS domain-containing protein n=1 Tax=Nostoc sp. UHCC 0302 TaxID=3134896 RepID=UPI00311CBACD